MTLPGVRIVDFEVDKNDVVGGALELMKTLRQQWKADEIKTTVFTDGITNKLVGCRHISDDAKTDMVLTRVYGEGTERIIDRNIEMLNMRLLHAVGCSEALYCKFNNGICYGFSPGVCLDEKLVREPKVCRLIAQEMVHMQKLNPFELLKTLDVGDSIEFDEQPCLFKKLNNFLSNVPDEYPDPDKNERFKRDIKSKAALTAELKQMQGIIESLNCPIVFAHNDILLKNVVYNEERERAYFIDYEYGAFNYLPFDIGNHFCEYAGMDEVDYALYPDKEYQLGWLRMYLEIKYVDEGKKASEVTDQVVQTLYSQVQKFALMSHLFWGFWALVQARYSQIDFDYLDYAKVRLGEYFSRKDEFLAL